MIKKQALIISLSLAFNAIAMELNDEFNAKLAGAIFRKNSSLVKDLIARNADVNWSGKDGLTPLIRATFCEDTEIVTTLIEANADLEKETCYHHTALIRATLKNYPETVSLLINAGANVSCTTEDGLTPLMLAVDSRAHEIATMLLQAKADIYHTANNGMTALNIATSNYHPDTVQFVLNEMTRLSSLEKSSVKNWLLVARRLHNEKRGLPKDLKNLIAQTIWNSLVQDIHKRLIKFGALRALTFLEKRPYVHEFDLRNANWVETSQCLNGALNMN
jgi:ankyrin repeat protein